MKATTSRTHMGDPNIHGVSCAAWERGLRRAEGRRLKCLGIYDHGAHARGVTPSLSPAIILTLSIYVIPSPPYSNAIPAHFYLCLFLTPFFFLSSSNNPCSLCNQSRYTQLFTSNINEAINTLIKEENIQTHTNSMT
jgi:hypothetical protein